MRHLGLVGGTSWVSTEQGLLRHDGDAEVPLIDTTEVHCRALPEFIAGG